MDKRFIEIRPFIVEDSPEPRLYNMIVMYYLHFGVGFIEANALAKKYVEEWANLEE